MNIKAKPFSPPTGSRFRGARHLDRGSSRGSGQRTYRGEMGGEVVIKIQVWTTGRAGIGGVASAKAPDDVRVRAERMLAMKVGTVSVEAVLMEEKIAIEREFFFRSPLMTPGEHCVFPFARVFSSLMKAPAKPKGKTKNVPFDPIFFAATVPPRKPTAEDLKDVSEHENDPIEPIGHETMDSAVEDL